MVDDIEGWRISAIEENHGLAVLAEVDILVVGGGAAGVAAATVAGEGGRNVLLLEKYGFCGGAAVAGMSGTICGMYYATDRNAPPEQVVFGFTERFRRALEAKGGVTPPQKYGKTFTVTHDPLVWRECADHLLRDAGVKVLYHTTVVGVLKGDDALRGIVVESKAGRSTILAKRIIDASGDAAVVARSGFDYTFGDNGKIQNPTMFFRIGNVQLDRYLAYWGDDTICPTKVSDLLKRCDEDGSYDLPRHKIWIFPTTRPNELMVNATRLVGSAGKMLNVTNPEDFTEAEMRGRLQVREYARFLADHIPGCEDSYVVDTGVEAGIRQTRTIVGVDTLRNSDVVGCRKNADSICKSPWPIELHSGDRPKLHWLLDDYYDVPYASLVPNQGTNIIVAGRCLSAEHEALASARVTAQCFEYGNAAAAAAMLSLDERMPFHQLAGSEVKKRMQL